MPTREENGSIPPPPFRLTSSGAVERWQGGGWVSLLGAPFFLAGVFLALTAAGVVPTRVLTQGWTRPRSSIGLMSLALLSVGGALVFGRRSLTFDVGSGYLTRHYWLLIPVWTEQRPLSEFNTVVLAFQLGDADAPDRYPVRLRAIGRKDFKISSGTKFEDSRSQAEFLSRFLRLPLTDMTTDHEAVISPEQTRETLQERLRSGSARIEKVDRPPFMRSEVNESREGASIVIPLRKSPLAVGAAVVVSSAVMLLLVPALWRDLTRSDTPIIIRLLFLGFLVFAFGILPLLSSAWAFGAIRNRTAVKASPEGLAIERGGWRRRREAITAADIIDVDYSTFDGILKSARRAAGKPPGDGAGARSVRIFDALKKLVPNKGIIVKSRKGLITFAEGLPAEELRFLKSVLMKALAGR